LSGPVDTKNKNYEHEGIVCVVLAILFFEKISDEKQLHTSKSETIKHKKDRFYLLVSYVSC
jgi:hypothetical protein